MTINFTVYFLWPVKFNPLLDFYFHPQEESGVTALMMAAEGGHNETVKTLIAAGADVTLKVGL